MILSRIPDTARRLTSLQFHFASILSPWIRRSLVAAGFGIGSPDLHVRQEIAPVTRYHDQFISDPQHSEESHYEEVGSSKIRDPEDIVVASSPVSSNSTLDNRAEDGAGTLVPSTTPHFHFDLAAAVQAAERSVAKG